MILFDVSLGAENRRFCVYCVYPWCSIIVSCTEGLAQVTGRRHCVWNYWCASLKLYFILKDKKNLKKKKNKSCHDAVNTPDEL